MTAMDEKDNELFEGIQIMSPQETENVISNEDKEITETEENSGEEEKNESEMIISAPEETTSTTEIDNTTEEQTSTSETKPAANSRYAALIKDLLKDGIIAGPEEEELKELLENATEDTIKNLMANTLETAFKSKETNWKNNFSGAKKRFLEIEDNFSDADLAIQMAQRLDFFDNVSDEEIKDNKEMQKQLYFQLLKSKNFSDSDAFEAIEEADSIDKLMDKAQKALPVLKQEATNVINNAKKQKEEQEVFMQKEQEKNYNNLMEAIEGKDEFINGLKLNKVAKEKIKNNIVAPIYEDEDGKKYTSLMYKQMRNPADFQILINYYDSLGLFDFDKEGKFKPNISKLKNVAKTKAVSELDRVFNDEEERGIGRGNSNSPSDKTSGILDLLERGFNNKKKK